MLHVVVVVAIVCTLAMLGTNAAALQRLECNTSPTTKQIAILKQKQQQQQVEQKYSNK